MSDPLHKPADPPLSEVHHPQDIRVDDVTDCPILTFARPGGEVVTVRLTREAARGIAYALSGGWSRPPLDVLALVRAHHAEALVAALEAAPR